MLVESFLDALASLAFKGRVHKTKSGKSLVFCQTGQGWPPPDLSEMHGEGGMAAGTKNRDSRRPEGGERRRSPFV